MSQLQFNKQTVSMKLDDGREISIETGMLARQADGAVLVRQGNAAILATVVASKEPRPGQSFFPLSVDYQEKFASAGRIPGSFFKREGRISDPEILISRLVDRALRPLFPENYYNDVQVLVTLVSNDSEVVPDALACLAASAALAVSNIPIQEIISEVRVARIGGQFVVNPTRTALKDADMDFIIAATEKNIMMVEGEANECNEEDMIVAIETAHEAIRKQVKMQEELRAKVGNPEKKEVVQPEINQDIKSKVEAFAKAQMQEISRSGASKHERSGGYKLISEGLKKELFPDLEPGMEPDGAIWGAAKSYLEDLQYHTVRDMILDEGRRLDGRDLETVRPLDMHIDYLPGPHGCALFTRGETQSLTTATLGTSDDELLVESANQSDYKKFILHYNFPPFSTGETKPMRGPGRREVGHGNLAKRSLEKMMPNPMDYPYTVRVVSDILESNGSSSMATVCAGSLALMDAGVPFPKHVAGVAMGLIAREKDGKWAVLTDILGDEDHLGDMDFKVTGTRDGICGIQMDIKVDGLSMDVMRAALQQARRGRLHILDAMYECTPAYRAEMKSHAPRVEQTIIEAEFIGAIIGPGGKIIQEIQRETNTKISVDEADGKGYVKIFSSNGDDLKKAMNWVKSIAAQPEIGEEYEGTVKSIMPFGAFIEFMPGKQGLLHISEVSWSRLDSLEGVMAEGDKVKVKLIGTDPKTGKLRLSRKALMPQPEGYQEPERRDRGDRNDRGPRGEGRFDRGDRPRGEGRGEGGRGSDRSDRPRGEGRGEGGRGSERGDRNDRGPRGEGRSDRGDRPQRENGEGNDRPRREFQGDQQGDHSQHVTNNDTQSRPNDDWNPASIADNGQGSGGFASPAPADDDKDLML